MKKKTKMVKMVEMSPFEVDVKGIKVGNGKTCYVELYPKKDKHSRSNIDVLRLNLENKFGSKQYFDMTPDEALEIASTLDNAVYWWLCGYKPYRKEWGGEIKKLDKKLGKIKRDVKKEEEMLEKSGRIKV